MSTTTLLLPFLRPLPAPRPSYVRSFFFLRREISSASTTTSSGKADVDHDTTTPSTITPTNTAPPPPPPPPPPTPQTIEKLPYHVHRTPSQQLPIYHTTKRGGNLQETRIRKVQGDSEALKKDLQKALALGADKKDKKDKDKDAAAAAVRVNPLNGHVVVKGWRKKEVAAFLEARRF